MQCESLESSVFGKWTYCFFFRRPTASGAYHVWCSVTDCLSAMNIAAVSDMPTVTVSMHDVSGTEYITTKQRMMSSCTGAILTSFFSKFSSYTFCDKLNISTSCSVEEQERDLHSVLTF